MCTVVLNFPENRQGKLNIVLLGIVVLRVSFAVQRLSEKVTHQSQEYSNKSVTFLFVFFLLSANRYTYYSHAIRKFLTWNLLVNLSFRSVHNVNTLKQFLIQEWLMKNINFNKSTNKKDSCTFQSRHRICNIFWKWKEGK